MMQDSPHLFAWGASEDNQLGTSYGPSRSVTTPTPVELPISAKISRLDCGYKHTLLLTCDGEVYSCGCNEYGQLGRSGGASDFRRITAFENHTIIDIACGAFHNAAITYTGALFTWGCNSNGQLGREGEDPSVKLVRSLSEHRIIQASLGLEHSLVLTDTSLVFAFGSNVWGQLGFGFRSDDPLPVPSQIVCMAGLPVRQICAGGMHSLLVTISGSVYAWGGNKYGQLGIPINETSTSTSVRSSVDLVQTHSVTVPTLIPGLKSQKPVFVSCGESHTAVLTQDGRVFTFGANQFGQLGHNESSKYIPVPRQVADLMGSVITQLACGRMHTFAFNPGTGQLFAFGSGTEGQLGQGETENSLRPIPVQGNFVPSTTTNMTPSFNGSRGFAITHLYAGGDHAFLYAQETPLRDPSIVSDFRRWNPSSSRSIAVLCSEALHKLRNSFKALPLPAPRRGSVTVSPSVRRSDSDSTANTENYYSFGRIETVFSSLGCLSATCLVENHFSTGREEPGVDLDAARDLQRQLFQQLSPKQLSRLINKLIHGVLAKARRNYPGIECLRGLMVLAVSDLLNCPSAPITQSLAPNVGNQGSSGSNIPTTGPNDPSQNDFFPVHIAGFPDPGIVLQSFAAAINKLEAAPSKIIDRWLAKIQPRYFKRLVTNLNNLVTYVLNMRPNVPEHQRRFKEESVRSSLELMKRLHRLNESKQQSISHMSFYIPTIKEKVNIESAFLTWLRECQSDGMRFFSFCDYPFVFDAPTKARLLSIEAMQSMRQAANEASQNALLETVISPFFGRTVVATSSPFCHIIVRRDAVLQDALAQIVEMKPSDLRKILRVKFQGEEAEDEGGVMKEFFLLIMRDLLDPVYGMFRFYPESRMLWFNEATMETDNVFRFVGILCGLAIYNSIIVDLAFPLAMFRKLLGGTPVLDDLQELDPTVGRSLHQLLEYEGRDVAEVFCLTFSLDMDYYGTTRRVELIENGSNIAVTHENKALYVEKYVDYVFNRSCAMPYEAFQKGFHSICSGYALKFFRPMELQSLVVGSEVVDWNELRHNTVYHGVYWDHHPVIEWFWEVLLTEFSVEEKKKFLRYLTGCDRVPIVGFVGLKIAIQPVNSGDNYLPVAHTCSNLLDLPLYTSKEILSRKLSLAIQQTEGFGLV